MFHAHYADPTNGGSFWKPTGDKVELTAPFLLALPNAIVEILRGQTGPATPGDLWDAIEEVVTNAGQDQDPTLWDTIQKWCLCASQAGNNGKSLMVFEVDLVVIDDEEFDKWVGDKTTQTVSCLTRFTYPPSAATPQVSTNLGPVADLSDWV